MSTTGVSYTVIRNDAGVVTGVLRSDGAFVPMDKGNRDWNAFLEWNAQQVPPLSLANGTPTRRVPRTVLAIYTDLAALTATQKQRIGDDLFAGSPMKILTDPGPNAGSIVGLYWGATKAGVSAAAVLDAKLWAAAMWSQDNPAAFVRPSYDQTISVAGDAPAA